MYVTYTSQLHDYQAIVELWIKHFDVITLELFFTKCIGR